MFDLNVDLIFALVLGLSAVAVVLTFFAEHRWKRRIEARLKALEDTKDSES